MTVNEACRRKIWRLSLLCLTLFLLPGCTEPGSRKEYPCGLFGLGRTGSPEAVLGGIVDRINSSYRETGRFPEAEAVSKMLPSGRMFLYYSFTEDRYQLAYWSGETAWIYDSATDSYYETEKDMIREKWYPVRDSTVDTEKLHYNPLY